MELDYNLQSDLEKIAKFKYGIPKKLNLKGILNGSNIKNIKSDMADVAGAIGKDSHAYKNLAKSLRNEKVKRVGAFATPVGVAGATGAGALAYKKHKDNIEKSAYEMLGYDLEKEAKVNFNKVKKGAGKLKQSFKNAKTSLKEIATGKRLKDNYNSLKFIGRKDPEYQRYNQILKKELGKTVGLYGGGAGALAGGVAGVTHAYKKK